MKSGYLGLSVSVVLIVSASTVARSQVEIQSFRGTIRGVDPGVDPTPAAQLTLSEPDLQNLRSAAQMIMEGRRTFRFDTFGNEAFWGDTLKLHQAVQGEGFGGTGPGLSPRAALDLGLKVDADAIPAELAQLIRQGQVDLNAPSNTLALLKLNAVVGVTGFFNEQGGLRSIGIQCAICHSTVNDSFSPGIGQRLDGWPNRDLNIGAIAALAPDLSAFVTLLGVDLATVQNVLKSWGPGKFDAELILDGKAFNSQQMSHGVVTAGNVSGATLIPAAFGLAGVNLSTYTGWGSVTHWNAFVSNLEMHGQGTFFDPRLANAEQFPIAARAGFGNVRNDPDLITPKLAALHLYQLSLPAPTPPPGSFDAAAAERGRMLFNAKAQCAVCHVPPLFTEPGWNMHTAAEIGIDDFQANRSPDRRYRTTPLKGLFARQKGGFFHDGRFATLLDVVDHYNIVQSLALSDTEKNDVVEYLKSL
jgi:hypothetical protein